VFAAETGNVSLVQLLLDHASRSGVNLDIARAITAASARGHANVVQQLQANLS
jgi:hypothetical protein